MLARVVTIQVKPEKMDECIRIFKEVNAPSIAARPGFDHGHGWVDRTSGQATSVTFWENEADEEASRANIPHLVEGMSHVLGSEEVYQETFELVHDQHSIELSEGTSSAYPVCPPLFTQLPTRCLLRNLKY
jgi:heme-degrading monooxygenase HmoA